MLTQWQAIQEQSIRNREQTFIPVTCMVRNRLPQIGSSTVKIFVSMTIICCEKSAEQVPGVASLRKSSFSNSFKKSIKRICLESDAVVECRGDVGLKVATVLRMVECLFNQGFVPLPEVL